MIAPDLETERLHLRAPRLEDFDESLALWSDPRVVQFIGGQPSTPQQVWMRLLQSAGQWQLLGYGRWTLIEKATGSYVGEAGLADFRRDIDPRMTDAPEAGWVLAPRFHGKGYATEAVRAALDWSDSQLGATRVVCLIHAHNLASLRVAEKCGFREFERAPFGEAPAVFLERLR